MATTGNGGPTTGNGGPAQGGAGQPQTQAHLNVLGQYIKDFSFENPNAPRSLTPSQVQPAINIQINVGVQQLAPTDYEVTLKLEGKAESKGIPAASPQISALAEPSPGMGEGLLFAFDLTFSGVFRVQNIPQESLHPLIMIECPRLLFPFAREIIATAVRNGGFPPLLLDPVDFFALYQQRAAQVQPGAATPAAS
jgi:preprotein translocase subunit SecB